MTCCCPFTFLISTAGYALIGLVAYKLLRSTYNILYPYLIGTPLDLQKLTGPSKWAVITGASDGIGKAYAFELAARNFNLVLIARSGDKLAKVAREIESKVDPERGQDVQVRTIVFDFTDAALEDYETIIFSQLDELQIGILVNNVGMIADYPERLDKLPGGLQSVRDLTVVNTLPHVLLSAYVLRQMTERVSGGVVVNIASAAAYLNWYWASVYSATKRFMCSLAATLRKEYAVEGSGVVIQTICPMLVATKLGRYADALSLSMSPSAEAFVRQAIRTIGLADETAGCVSHQIQSELLFGYIPGWILDWTMRFEASKRRDRALCEEAKETNKEN